MSENLVKLIYLGIGSNLGNRKKNIEQTKFRLLENEIRILQISSFYETLSWPDPKNPKFLNIVLKIATNLTESKLLNICKQIESSFGRKKSYQNAPRICDIDIIDYKNKKKFGKIILPHPRMHSRNFVLFPLFEINKKWRHPVSKDHIKTLLNALSNNEIRSIKQV
jgi:2-amino-4-hydroxy-6-hydroxymethyldihydropteridine diphosphokinase